MEIVSAFASPRHTPNASQSSTRMSFFDFSKPQMFDVKKRIAVAEQAQAAEQPPALPPLPPTQLPSGADSMPESWVELAPSRQSLCSSVDANLVLVEGEKEHQNSGNSNSTKDSRLSPVSVQSPHVEFETSLEQVKYKLARDMLPPGRGTDWIWDWSSRPEAMPPKGIRMRQYGSNLTTPPNSPAPELSGVFSWAAGAHDDAAKPVASFLSVKVVVGFIVTNFVTFVLGAAIGFAVCKRLAKQKEI